MSLAPSPATIRFGPFELDVSSGELRRLGRKVRLQWQSFQILSVLIERAGEVVTREELRQELWSADTYVDFDHGLNNAVKRLREALGDSAEKPRYVETLPRKGYRFIGPVPDSAIEPASVVPSLERPSDRADKQMVQLLPREENKLSADSQSSRSSVFVAWGRWIFAVLILMIATAATFLFNRYHARTLTDQDTVVVADFTNTTGDAVFDGTLRQGLAVQLGQSPFLSLVSEVRIQQLLGMMAQPRDARLTPALARELCERNNSAAFFDGSIAVLGKQYVLALRATNCHTGGLLAQEQIQTDSKEQVLGALDTIAKKLRRRVGESITTVQRYDTPLAEATTPSLEALKAYSVGVRKLYWDDPRGSIPFFQRAVTLDPNFAAAYAMMSCACILQPDVATRNIRKAYALREKVSEGERLFIESVYDEIAMGDLKKAMAANEVWADLYPREFEPARALAEFYTEIGDAETAVRWGRKALALGQENAMSYQILAWSYVRLNRLAEAQDLYKQDEDRRLADPMMNGARYLLAFFAHDQGKMEEFGLRDSGKPGAEDAMLDMQADTARWSGKLKLARELTERASNSAKHNDAIETAAIYRAKEALFEAEIGDLKSARLGIESSMKLSLNRNVKEIAPLVLTWTGDRLAAEKITSELERDYPQDTLATGYWLPAIHAANALQRNDPRNAIVLSQTPNSIDLAFADMLTVYLRGEAYLKLHDGERAAIEFQKFLDHWGLVRNAPEGALARLGLARAYAVQGNVMRARAAYETFLTLWLNADPDIPLLKRARVEYAQLH
jgi:eukaryotic-like serine/threonine-protein kinase